MDEVEKVKTAMAELGEEISVMAKHIAMLDFRLQPYWTEKGRIEHDIRQTHNRRGDGAVIYGPNGRLDRVPLFADLDALNKEWELVRTDRSEAKLMLSIRERDYKRLDNELKYQTRKAAKVKPKSGGGQGGLL